MILLLAWRNLWRNKKRSIITITSIAIAVFLAVFMRSMQLGMYDNMIKNVVGKYTGYIQIHAKNYWEEQNLDNTMVLDDKLTQELKKEPGIVDVIPRLQSFSLASSGELSKGVMIQGIDMNKEQQLTDWNLRLKSGKLFSPGDHGVILAKGVAKYFKKEVGDTIVFIGQGFHGMSAAGKYRIQGIVNMRNPKINDLSVFLPLSSVQNYLSAPGRISNLVIQTTAQVDIKKLSKKLEGKLDPNIYEIMTWHEMLPELDQTILADSIGGLIMVFILYMIITFGIFGTVLMMTQERMYELGIMVSIGMKKTKLMFMLVVETIALSLIGVVTGALLVAPLVWYYYVNPIKLGADEAEMMEKFGFENSIPMLIDFDIPLTHGLIIFVISLLISLYPVITVLRLNPLKAMRI